MQTGGMRNSIFSCIKGGLTSEAYPLKFFAILKPMPHLGQLTVEGFFITSTMAPQSLQMMRALIETVAVFLSLFDAAMATPFQVENFHSFEAVALSCLPGCQRAC